MTIVIMLFGTVTDIILDKYKLIMLAIWKF